MKKLIKINLLFTAFALLILCSATITYSPYPGDCKKYIITVDIGEDGAEGTTSTVLTCPNNLCLKCTPKS